MTEIIRAPETSTSAEPSAGINFALVLSRTLDTVRDNPAELRAVVYELARVKLKEQFGNEDADEVKRLTAALDEAIQGVESFSREEARRQLLAADGPGGEFGQMAIGSTVPAAAPAPEPDFERALPRAEPIAAQAPRMFGSIARLGLVLVVAAGIVAAVLLWPQLRRLPVNLAAVERPTNPSAPVRAVKAVDAPASVKPEEAAPAVHAEPPLPFPLPTRFGVYAVSDGQLQELKSLPGKVPDSRVAVSAAINAPSATVVSDTRPKFIVFRRDGAVSAPDRVELRLVARVTRAMGVDSGGKAKMTPEQDAWVIRNIAIPYGVGPVDDQHPDMYLIQPESADTVLPAGRYALVLKGQGFDFVIDGPITDPRQCMERIDAVNGAFYSPCPQQDKASDKASDKAR